MFDLVSLHVNCPSCKKSLMDDDVLVDNTSGIRIHVRTSTENGTIWLSSMYGSYNYICDIALPNNDQAEFYCPHCHVELSSGRVCNICKSPLVSLKVDDGSRVSLCCRNGCKKHFIEFDDHRSALRRIVHEHEFSFSEDDDAYLEDVVGYNEPLLY
ncbi:MAG: class I tRNA ligase family protein [Bacteroidetes bacterium]|nr:class I tRNA ligase family protein [Bacteroidota bacterium]